MDEPALDCADASAVADRGRDRALARLRVGIRWLLALTLGDVAAS
jgi:hypothetical protein